MQYSSPMATTEGPQSLHHAQWHELSINIAKKGFYSKKRWERHFIAKYTINRST